MNSSIESHDTKIAEISSSVAGITIRFAPAYIHKSAGRPGIDPGTGWSQEAELFISYATLVGKVPPLPCLLTGGTLVVGSRSHKNMIPLPLDTKEPTTITLGFGYLDFGIEVQGEGSSARLIGEARYVEEFRPSRKSHEP